MHIINIATKILNEEDGEIEFSVKILVENKFDDPDVILEIQGLDSEGFEIFDIIVTGNVPFGNKKSLTTRDEVNAKLYKRITNWQDKDKSIIIPGSTKDKDRSHQSKNSSNHLRLIKKKI